MADYYTNYSAVLDNVPAEADDWIKRVLNLRPEDEASIAALQDLLNLETVRDEDFCCNWPAFGLKIEKQDNGALSLWFHDDGDGQGLNDDHIICFVQALLQRYMPESVFKISFACTCSKPRVDSFGGYWIVVSKDDVASGNTFDEATEAAKKMQASR